MRLSIVSDELSSDLHTALEILNEQQCKEIEVRRIGFETFPDIDERWLAIAEKAVAAKRVRVTSVAPGIFGAPGIAETEKIFTAARRLHSQVVSLFAPRAAAINPGQEEKGEDEAEDEESGELDWDEDAVELPPEQALDALRRFAGAAERAGLAVVLRTHPESYAGTADEALAVLKALELPGVGLDWDVAACFAAGDGSGLDALPDVLPVLKAVHARDAIRKGLGADWVSMGKGVIPWQDIVEQLFEAGYRGPVVLEPGVAPKVREARAALTQVARWIDACRLNHRRPKQVEPGDARRPRRGGSLRPRDAAREEARED